jgi:DNA polymerase-3 subunit gamma/tau
MSYIVFALKWRPKIFDEIVGQDHIVTTLKNAIQKNRLAHAYLFSGPRGVGKTSTARILAKALNCKDGPTATPCGKCSSCLEIAQGRSLDILEIDGASNRGIDEIRALRENVKFAPTSGKYKVYIIDEVHQITSDGFNALLKTLEEPPEFVKFIFATTQPNKVPPTILSRCQRLDFRRISTIEIIAQLEKVAGAEKINVDKEVLFAVAKASDGSLRDAESILDQLISFSKDKVSLRDAVSMLGLVSHDKLFEITDRIINKDARGALSLFNEIIDEGKDISVFLSNIIEHFRNLMIAKVTQADAQLIDLPQDICERLLKQAQAVSLAEILNVFNILVNTQEMSKRMDSLRIPLEISLVKLAHDKKSVNINLQPANPPAKIMQAPLKDKPVLDDPVEDCIKGDANDIPADINKTAEVLDSASLDSIKDAWQSIIDNLTKVKISLATYLNEGSPFKLEDNVLTIAFPTNLSLHKEALETRENRALIEKVFHELLNIRIRVNFILSAEAVKKEVKAESDGFVKSALDLFQGRVIRE